MAAWSQAAFLSSRVRELWGFKTLEQGEQEWRGHPKETDQIVWVLPKDLRRSSYVESVRFCVWLASDYIHSAWHQPGKSINIIAWLSLQYPVYQ